MSSGKTHTPSPRDRDIDQDQFLTILSREEALARKVASGVGIAEIVLLERKQDLWSTLAVGELSLEAIARAEAWLLVSGGSEGFAAGSPVDAYMLRD